MHGRSLGALVAAVAIVAAGLAAVPRESAPALEAAPPPAICRAAPAPAGWPEVGASGDVADLSGYQDYRGALGIGDGLRGAGVAIADVEYEWRRTHVELSSLGLPAPPDTGLPAGYQAADHGTAVLGVLGARADGQGVSGLAPDADLRPISPFATGTYDPAGAVKAAAGGLGPGDVLLIELQALEDGQLVPIESIPAVRAQIRAAVDARHRGRRARRQRRHRRRHRRPAVAHRPAGAQPQRGPDGRRGRVGVRRRRLDRAPAHHGARTSAPGSTCRAWARPS